MTPAASHREWAPEETARALGQEHQAAEHKTQTNRTATAAPEGAIRNAKAIGRAVGDYLAGNLAGQRMVAEMRGGHSDPDHLFHTVRASAPSVDGDYLRGLLRSIQKVIERELGHG